MPPNANDIRDACVHVGRVFPKPAWQMAPHLHEQSCEFIVVLAGKIQTHIAGQVLTGLAGDVLFYPRKVEHAERAIGAQPLETIFITWQDTGVDTAGWPLIAHDRLGRMQTLARWMYDDRMENQHRHAPLLDVLLQAMLHAYTAGHMDAEDEMVTRVKRFVAENLTTRLSLDDLAAAACLSRFHFARRFQKLTHMSPARFVREARVDAARTLLLSSNLPVRTVATQVGFPDAFQFSRVFRRHTGRSPSDLRRATHPT